MAEAPFASVLWQERGFDVLVQIGLIFAGVLGILGLLREPLGEQQDKSTAEQSVVATRDVVPGKPIPRPVLEEEPA